MDNIQLTIRGELFEYDGPSDWNEVTEKEALQLCRLIGAQSQKPEMCFLAFQILYKMPLKHLQWLFDEDFIRRVEPSMPQEDIDDCLEQGKVFLEKIQWIFNESPTNWLLKSVSKFPKVWYGPETMLGHSSFEEFSFAESYYERFCKNPSDLSNLNKLIATLYRRGNKAQFDKKGDYRMPFIPAMVSVNLPFAERLSPEAKHLILLNYGGVRKQFAKMFKHVFSTENTKSAGVTSWLDVGLSLAGDNFANFAQIKTDFTVIVLRYLNNRISQQKEIEKRAKK